MFDEKTNSRDATVWYFAYGSNMSSEKFTGSRGITPLERARAKLPGWKLSMNIPGMPYSEPSFSSIKPSDDVESTMLPDVLGVAYRITLEQYKKVIASEGGQIVYDDILLDAIPISFDDEVKTGGRFKVRTLGGAVTRHPAPKPSQRYMDLLTVGAAEAGLPAKYQSFLASLPVYRPPHQRSKRMVAAVFLVLWGPVMSLMEKITHATAQADGNNPFIIVFLVRMVVYLVWVTHDWIFAPLGGRGDGVDQTVQRKEVAEALLNEKAMTGYQTV